MKKNASLEEYCRSLREPLSVDEVALRLNIPESILLREIHLGAITTDGEGNIKGKDLADYLLSRRVDAI